jgi:hypothetical protein
MDRPTPADACGMRLPALAAVGALAALAISAPASAAPTHVTLHCTSFDFTLPQGPPPRVGEITVVHADGTVQVDHFVPGPCSIPKK